MYYESSDFLETADSDTLKQIARTRELTREYYFSDYVDMEKRTSILRELLGGMGENVAIDTPFHCDYGKNIFLGNDVIINMNCTFVDNKTIRIGDRVLIASNVQIYTSSHPVLPQERLVPDWRERKTTFFRTYARPIEIESNVWIGGGCILLPGVTIGENSVIGAGSVVTRPVPPNCVAVGIHAGYYVILIQTGKGGSMKYKHIVFDIDGITIKIPTMKSTATIARILITHTSPPVYAIFWLNPLS